MTKEKVFAFLDMENNFQHFDAEHELWVLLVNGNRVQCNSGKNIWKKKNHAIMAAFHHIDEITFHYFNFHGKSENYDFQYKDVRAAKKEWVKLHCEAITLEEWNKRKANI